MSLDTTTTSCKRKYLSCDYNDCDQIINDPIILTGCGQTICSNHLEEMILRNRNTYKCSFCKRTFSNPVKNLKLQQLINDGVSDEYNQAKSALDDIKKIINQFETQNDTNIISEHFSGLRNKIDLKKELVIQNIEKYYSDLISQVNDHEKEYLNDYNKDLEKTNELGTTLDKVKGWSKDLNDLFHDTDYWSELSDEISKEHKEIKKKVEDYKYKLFGNKVPMFEESFGDKEESILGNLYNSDTPQYSFDQEQESYSLVGLSSGNEDIVMVSDNGARKSILKLPAMYSSVSKMCLITNEKLLLEITDRALHLFDVKSGECEMSFYHSNSAATLVYISRLNDEEFLCVYSDKCVKKYRIDSNLATSVIKLEANLHSSIFELNDTNQLLILPKSAPRNSYIINTNQNLELFKEKKCISQYYELVSSIPDSTRFIVVYENNKVARINHHLHSTYLFKEKERIKDITMISSNELAIAISNTNESQVNLWDTNTSNCIRSIKIDYEIISLCASEDLDYKLLCCLSGKALMLDLEKSEVVQEIDNLNGKLGVAIV